MADEALKELLEWLRKRQGHYVRRAEDWAVTIGKDSVMLAEESAGMARALQLGKRADALESALSELERLRGEREWKPIETAPKDGDPVLLLFRGEGTNDFVDSCYWDANFDAPHGAWVLNCECESARARFQCYTHWQPLPAPPVQSHEEKQG